MNITRQWIIVKQKTFIVVLSPNQVLIIFLKMHRSFDIRFNSVNEPIVKLQCLTYKGFMEIGVYAAL